MATLELRGKITESGHLEIQLPAGLPVGEVTVRIEVLAHDTNWENQMWTKEEIERLMTLKPMPRDEFLAWLDANPPTETWADLRDDEDAAEYIHRMRHQSSFTLAEPEDQE